MSAMARMFVLLMVVSLFNALVPGQAWAADTWFPTNDSGGTRYRTPHEACAAYVNKVIENDRPSRPPTAQYRLLESTVQGAGGDGDYHCTGLLHVRTGSGSTNWDLIPYIGDAFILGDPETDDPCTLGDGYTDPVNGQCGPPKCTGDCSGAGGNGSNPIHSASGNKYQHEADYVGAGAFPLRMVRSYNSNRVIELKSVPIGVAWSHAYAGSIAGSGSPMDLAIVHRPDGRVLRFQKIGGLWQSDPDVTERLSLAQDSTGMPIWTLTTSDDTVELYDGIGLLQSITNRAGQTQTLSYLDSAGQNHSRVQKVTDPEGRTLVFGYDANKHLTSLTDGNGQVISYGYDAAGNLATVTFPETGGPARTRTYHYNEPGQTGGTSQPNALTGITDENGDRHASWGYNDDARANLSVHGPFMGGTIDRIALAYNPDGTTTVTDALGKSRTFQFSVQYLVARLAALDQPCDYCDETAKTRTWDGNGYPDRQFDFRDVETDQDYDTRGLEIQRIEASSAPGQPNPAEKRTIQTDWHATFRVPTERRVRDDTGVLVRQTNWIHNSRGQALTEVRTDPDNGATRTTTMTWCEQADVDGGICPLLGLLRSVDGPRTDVSDLTSYTYYAADDPSCATQPTTCPHRKGDLQSITNALGQVTQMLRYDGAGRLLSMQDANGVVTDMEYHPRGWLTARKVRGANNGSEADDQITGIDYWPTGLVKQVTQPDGAFTAYTYDVAHRLTDITDNEGNTIHYTLDAAGNRLQEDTRDDQATLLRTLSRVYNQLGRLQTTLDADLHPTSYTFDDEGNPDTITDALARTSDSDHDPLNRLSRTLHDVGGIAAETAFEYDALDNLTKVTDPKALDTDYTYNGFNDLTRLDSPDTGITDYTYDSAGNRATRTDARQQTAIYSYDALNRLTGIAYETPSLDVDYTYDLPQGVCAAGETFSTGRLTRMDDGSGSTRYCHDRFGNLVRKVQIGSGQVFTVRYAYTAASQLASVTYPDGLLVDYVRDAQGRITEIGVTPAAGTRQVLLQDATWYPFGAAAEWVYGNGRLMRRSLNQNYQPGFVEDPFTDGISLGYEFNEVGDLVKLRDASQSEPPQRRYVHDALHRLTEARHGPTDILLQGYGYDATGNRTSATQGGTYVYDANSHRLTRIGLQLRTYDAAGNTATIGGNARRFTYDTSGRMSRVRLNGVTAMNYAYNGKGEQVRRYLGANSTYTVFDEAGRWLGDYNSTGAPIQQVIWLDDLPVGLSVGSANQLHYLEPDALGTPRVVIDPVQDEAIWTWDLTGEAFGNSAPDEDPDGDANNFVFDMRFPGQRYDVASGLNQNGFRDYEATTGRYPTSDPAGHLGGINTYAYAASNPLTWFDPDGLQAGTLTYPDYYAPRSSPVPGARTLPGTGVGGFAGCLNPIVGGILLMMVPGNVGQDASCSDDPMKRRQECSSDNDYERCVESCVRTANIENERCGIQFANDPHGYRRCAAAVIANLELCVAQCRVRHGIE